MSSHNRKDRTPLITRERSFRKALGSLDASGSQGFEGLVSDLLSTLTGQSFRVLKPGPQGGVDSLPVASGNGMVIGLEGKQYSENTPLKLDALKAKLVDAVHTYPELDLWLLVTSREVKANDQRDIKAVGDKNGIAVEVIDWPASPAILPLLAVLCAAAPSVVQTHLGNRPGVSEYLQAIEKDPQFDSARTELASRFTAADVGYASAQRYLASWTRDAFRDLPTAKARLGGFTNLLDKDVLLVRRQAIHRGLDDWFGNRNEVPLVLLGQEGLGKTWAVLSWWHDRAGAFGDGLPLTLIVPARDVDTTETEGLLARTLARRTALRNAEFWQRRLRLWTRQLPPRGHPKILLVIDGLNQNWAYTEWARLLQPLFAKDWRGFAAVILTCRPDHWQAQLKSLGDLEPRAEDSTVDPFSDPELDELLSTHSLHRDNFPEGLLRRMRVPRLSQVAIKHHKNMAASQDLSEVRLVLEDWRERIRIHGSQLAPTDDEFRNFVCDLGRQLHGQMQSSNALDVTMSRKQLFEALGRESGAGRQDLGMTVSEIVDGGWLEKVGEHHFRLQPDLAPFVLGLALVDQLKPVKPEEIQDRLAQFLDPIRGGDLTTEILRTASIIAVADAGASRELSWSVVLAWGASQSFGRQDVETVCRLVGGHPHLFSRFLDFAREFWLLRRGRPHEDAMLIKALASAWPGAAQTLKRRAVEWLSLYWPDPDAGAFLNYDATTPKAAQHRKTTAARRTEWDKVGAPLSPPLPLRCETDGDASWFGHRALGVLSFLPRQPFTRAFVGWAVSRAIMGRPRHFDEFAWILRWNLHDPIETETALLAAAEELLAINNSMTRDAARWLLEALATPTAMTRATQIRPLPSQPTKDGLATVDVEKGGRICWDHRTALQWRGSQETPLHATMGLDAFALDPTKSLAPEDCAVLDDLSSRMRPEQVWTHMGWTSEDIAFDHARVVLARWAPRALGNLLRRVFASASSRNREALRQLAWNVPGHMLILGDQERGSVADAAARMTSASSPLSRDDEFVLLHLLVAQLGEQPAARQMEILSAFPGGPNLDRKHRAVLAPPTADDFARIATYLSPQLPPEQLARWLWYLKLVPTQNMPPGYPPLVALIGHPDKQVRQRALEVIYQSRNQQLLDAVFRSDWRFVPEMDREEGAWGSLALCLDSGKERPAGIRERIDPQALGTLAVVHRSESEHLDAFANFVKAELGRLLTPSEPRVYPSHWANFGEATDLLVNSRPQQIAEWLTPLLEITGALRPELFAADFPVVDICRALLRHLPSVGSRLWLRLHDGYEHQIFRHPTLPMLPFEAPDNGDVEVLRDTVLDAVATDFDISRIAETVIEHGRVAWLLRCITRDLKGSSAGRMARGLTLAGFLDANPDAADFWATQLTAPPARGWLSEAFELSRARYQRNTWAHHWLDQFLSEHDRDKAFGYHALFLACADRRSRAWAPRRVELLAKDLPQPWLTRWHLCVADLLGVIKKADDENSRILCGTRILEYTQAPWL